MDDVCVLGAGAWGTALAKVLADKGKPTRVWAHEQTVADSINEQHENTRYLRGAKLPPNFRFHRQQTMSRNSKRNLKQC